MQCAMGIPLEMVEGSFRMKRLLERDDDEEVGGPGKKATCWCLKRYGGVYFVPARSKELDPKNWTHGDPWGPHGDPMGTHGNPWEPMETHGNPWVPMGNHPVLNRTCEPTVRT